MLSEKPWTLDAVLLLGASLLVSLSFAMLLGMALGTMLPEKAAANLKFYQFIAFTVGFQGVGLVLINHFLKRHQMSWGEFLGVRDPRLMRKLGLAVAVGILVVPMALTINKISALIITLIGVEPEAQRPVVLLQTSVSWGERTLFAISAIILAPLVEEILFRGILYPVVKRYFRPSVALLGTSLLFAAIHANLMTFVPLTFFAIILVLLYEWTDTLLAPIVTHCCFNAVNFFLLIYERDVTNWLQRLTPG